MRKIISISPHKAALSFAIISAFISLIFVIPMLIGFSSIPDGVDANGNPISVGPPIALFFGMPFFYFIFTYIFTLLATFIYNRASKHIGGIEIELSSEENT